MAGTHIPANHLNCCNRTVGQDHSQSCTLNNVYHLENGARSTWPL